MPSTELETRIPQPATDLREIAQDIVRRAMAGGATAEWARGRGAYRALVRARWDDAEARGTPALGVHAKETSAPRGRRSSCLVATRMNRTPPTPRL